MKIIKFMCFVLITFYMFIAFASPPAKDSIYYVEPKPFLGSSFEAHNKMKRQILIMGYYGHYNYGDELMLETLLKKKIIDFSNAEISVVFFPSPRYNFKQFPGIFAYYAPKSVEALSSAADFFDELIIGGGAHLDETQNNPLSSPSMMISLSKMMLEKNKKVRWLAVSANKELKDKKYISNLNYIISNCDEFSVRDTYSLKLLTNLGMDKKKIKLVKDLAYSYDKKKILAVTLINSSPETDKKHVEFIKDIISFIKRTGNQYEICFLPFFNRSYHDVKMFENLIKEINFDGVSYFIAPEYKNVDSMLLMIKGADLFINMRYHASLLSMEYGKPTISIIYDTHPHYPNKMKYLHEQYKNDNIIYYSKYQKGDLEKMLLNMKY
ncbi:MAG: polysaccharide pyruvyl transferase family protein [Pseudomonadota bacterium]|nr:polysaccharide pyruvyl transferase family protein [Pseudomonadota bacterium]